MYKSIYDDDLRLHEDGGLVLFKAKELSKKFLDLFPKCNPRELAHLLSVEVNGIANRAILNKRWSSQQRCPQHGCHTCDVCHWHNGEPE